MEEDDRIPDSQLNPNVGDNCCRLFDEQGFNGWWLELCANPDNKGFQSFHEFKGDNYSSNNKNPRGINWHDRIESFKCGKDVKWDFCWNPKGSYCDQDYGVSGAGAIDNPHLGYFRNTLSAVKL